MIATPGVVTMPMRVTRQPPLVSPALDHALLEKTAESVSNVDPLLDTLMRSGAYGAVKNRLLNLASDAVADTTIV